LRCVKLRQDSIIETLELSKLPQYHRCEMNAKLERGRQAVAAETWRLMAEFAFSKFQGSKHVVMLREMGLTPGHMKTLSILDPKEPRPMRAMADALACDASQVTWLVDRLEERGLVERGSDPSDRRVKTLVLTPEGIRTRERLREALYTPPDELLDMDIESLEALRDELRKLPAPERVFWSQSAAPREQRVAAAAD
jgi:DNA-binding MarR family transcriptional regulator